MDPHPVPPLSVSVRSCLLRAARKELRVLKDEHDALELIGMDAADSVTTEIDCLNQGVSWLWRYPAV